MGAKFLAETGDLQADAAIITEPAGIDRDWQGLYLGTRGSLLFRVDVEGTHGAFLARGSFRRRVGDDGDGAPDDRDRQRDAATAGCRRQCRCDCRGRHALRRARRDGSGAGRRALSSSAAQRGRAGRARGHRAAVPGSQRRARCAQRSFSTNWHSGRSSRSACRPAPRWRRRAAKPPPTSSAPSRRESIFPGGTDSFFIQGMAGIPTMPAFGPGCLREAHQPDEYVSLASLCAAPRLLLSAARALPRRRACAMTADLRGRVVWVTGAASGIGAATARLVASRGASVVCLDIDENGPRASRRRDPAGGRHRRRSRRGRHGSRGAARSGAARSRTPSGRPIRSSPRPASLNLAATRASSTSRPGSACSRST